ncbi:MAG: TetR/AcrR family transcriptional regulator [Coriobacteriia bacterium]|nr:TetR/AcrR family transcriptional regulator [Coriobacteriia bacterium]
MPKFSESEKVAIREKLLAKGEQLFIQHGFKKVTVEDLTKEVRIAKGSFYSFYKNKEHLYAEILLGIQRKVLADAEIFLQKNHTLPSRQLVKDLTLWSFKETEKYPLLLQQDAELISHLSRKLAEETYPDIDEEMMRMLVVRGVKFRHDLKLITEVSQTLTITFFDLRSRKGSKGVEAIMSILIDAVANEIVRDDEQLTGCSQ